MEHFTIYRAIGMGEHRHQVADHDWRSKVLHDRRDALCLGLIGKGHRPDQIDFDTLPLPFRRQYLGQADQGAFRHTVGLISTTTEHSGTRAGHHDTPKAPALHGRPHGMRNVPSASHVDPHDPLQVRHTGRFEGAKVGIGTRIVDQHVDPAP
ncbi:hypothetical protein D9M68_838560 [compost metagenome]